MGSSNSVQNSQGNINAKSKLQQKRHSPKKSIINSNGQKIRQPDLSLLKRSFINQSQNSKIQSINQNMKNHEKSIVPKQQKKISNSEISIDLNQNQSLYDSPNFVQALWNFMIGQSSNKPELTFQSFSELILSTLESVGQKFSAKIKKGQIYPIFSSGEEKDLQKDLQIFEITVKNRVHKYFSVSKKHPHHLGVQKYKQQVKQTIQKLGSIIICELMGKTSIWRSLMLLRQEQQHKIMQMLEKQGIDQKHLKQLTRSKIL